MKETMQQHLHTVGQKLVQNVISEYKELAAQEWGLFITNPTAPEKPLPKPQDKSKSHAVF